MQDMQKITLQENIALEKAVALFLPNSSTKQSAIKMYLQFKSNHSYLDLQRIDCYFKSALFIAEKSQYMYNMKGQKIKGISLPLAQILKSCQNKQHMIEAIREFLKFFKKLEKDVVFSIQENIQHWEFGYSLSTKFENAFKQLQLIQKVNESYGYKKTFLSFAWLLFSDARKRILAQTMTYQDNMCLIVACCYFMIRYAIDYIRPKFIEQALSKNMQNMKAIITNIIQTLIDTFSVSSIQSYKNIAGRFDNYFEHLLQQQIIKGSFDKSDFLSPEMININYKRLDTHYQKELDSDSIDFRLCIDGRIETLSPKKSHSISHNKPLKFKQPVSSIKNQQQNFASHRVLNYDFHDFERNQQISPGQKSNIKNQSNDFKLPKKMLHSPSLHKTPLFCATPITVGTQIYHYISNRAQTLKDPFHRRFYSEAMEIIESINMNHNKSLFERKNAKNKNLLTFSFYISIAEEFFEIQEQSQSYHRCLLAFSIYIVRMLNHLSAGNFLDIVYQLEPDILDLWVVSHYLSRFDQKMPQKIKNQIAQVQKHLIGKQIWMYETIIDDIAQLAAGMMDSQYLAILIRCILRSCQTQIRNIGNQLKLDYSICNQAYNCLKYFLSCDGYVFYHRYLDQIILCSVYVACKANHLPTKFNEITSSYQKTNNSFKKNHYDILCHVYAQQSSETNDIIKFYNQSFIHSAKPFILEMREPSFQLLHQCFQRPLKYEAKWVQHKPQASPSSQSFKKKPLKSICFDKNTKSSTHIYAKTDREIQKDPGFDRQCLTRNETTLRSRPPIVNIQFLCDTQKGRGYEPQ